MTRSPLVLRDATREDAAALAALWSECAADSDSETSEAFTQQSMWHEPSVAEAAEALELHLSQPDKRIIIALIEGDVVGATVCDLSTLTPVTMTRVLRVTDIQVSPRHRRRSIALTLLSAAASYGEEHDVEMVVAAIPTQTREPHRYLTKIGFSQVAVVRAIKASKLRSQVSSRATHSRDTGRLIAVRRTLRRRQGVRQPDRQGG
ncbi:GNAT family N-acetyltransferase [Aeromicrobium sp. CTD01-1L150]|uniref:GNAT family N-acetyltransferase n=1 Tax=Aeromicrobium sp. CTD01-1L150 TaxID=3341830 RepID=UPI0035BF9642